MSLDVCLRGPDVDEKCICDCGHEHEKKNYAEYYWANITHNLNTMAEAAGIYDLLWRPDEMVPPITTAAQLIPLLQEGLGWLKADPEKFKKFDAPNGWGLYVHFVPFVEKYLNACKEHPEALVRVSR